MSTGNEVSIEEVLKENNGPTMGSVAKSEIRQRMQGMDEKEMQIAVKSIPSSILWDELRNRYEHQSEMISNARSALRIAANE